MVALATLAVAGVVALREADEPAAVVPLPEGADVASTERKPVRRGRDAAVGENGWIVQVLEFTPNANAAVGRDRPAGGRQWALVRVLVVRRPGGRRLDLELRLDGRAVRADDCGDMPERGDDLSPTLAAGAGVTVDLCFEVRPVGLDDAVLHARDGAGGEAWLALT